MRMALTLFRTDNYPIQLGSKGHRSSTFLEEPTVPRHVLPVRSLGQKDFATNRPIKSSLQGNIWNLGSCRCLHCRSARNRSQYTSIVHSLSLSRQQANLACRRNTPTVPVSLTNILGTGYTHCGRSILDPFVLASEFEMQGVRLMSQI